MNRLHRALSEVRAELDRREVEWALVGGLAVSARTEPRFTRDVDLAVAVSGDSAAERLVRDLSSEGYTILETVEQEYLGRLATVRLAPPSSDPAGVVVDLLFASSGIELEIARSAEIVEILPGLLVPVASVAALIVLKLLARDDDSRPQDSVDLKALVSVAGLDDLRSARGLAAQVEERGFHRERELVAAIDALSKP